MIYAQEVIVVRDWRRIITPLGPGFYLPITRDSVIVGVKKSLPLLPPELIDMGSLVSRPGRPFLT